MRVWSVLFRLSKIIPPWLGLQLNHCYHYVLFSALDMLVNKL